MVKNSFEPISGFSTPRFAGIPTFMRLPHILMDDPDSTEVDIGLVGVPFDGGTTNRPGARHGPRQLRDWSTMIRRIHPSSGIDPFILCRCADLGDVSTNPANLDDTLDRIAKFYRALRNKTIAPLSAGGDHLISLPILRGIAPPESIGLVQFDSHTDLFDDYFGGSKYTHGTPFRRAIEEGLLDPKKVVQVGIRGTLYDGKDIEWGRSVGVRIIEIDELMDRGHASVISEVHQIIGNYPVYISFDIDFVDPAFAPGTGTPEIGGPNTYTAQKLVQGLRGLNIVGADLVEVSPPLDPTGTTAWVGASMMFELLCVLAENVGKNRLKD